MFSTLLSCEGQRSERGDKQDFSGVKFEGTYHYVYPYNTADLIEDHYIVFENNANGTTGRYYGTSDEFEENREEHLPGFFVAEMKDLKTYGDSITFKLILKDDDVFTNPIAIDIHSAKEARQKGFENWEYAKYLTLSKDYIGIIKGDSIFFKGSIPLLNKSFKKKGK